VVEDMSSIDHTAAHGRSRISSHSSALRRRGATHFRHQFSSVRGARALSRSAGCHEPGAISSLSAAKKWLGARMWARVFLSDGCQSAHQCRIACDIPALALRPHEAASLYYQRSATAGRDIVRALHRAVTARR
jgi:hypothetical protein